MSSPRGDEDLVMSLLLKPNDLQPLTLLVHPSISILQGAVDELQATHGWPVVSVNGILTQALTCVEPHRRGVSAQHALEAALAALDKEPVILHHISLLFEPMLALDPLLALQQLTRQRRLVIAWPGTSTGERLCYAVPEHAHYRTWAIPEALIVAL